MISISSLVVIGVSLLLALVASWIILMPFFDTARIDEEEKDIELSETELKLVEMNTRKDTVFRSIEELEHDFRSSKLTAEDYQQEKADLTEEAARCLSEIDQLIDASKKASNAG